MGRYERRIYFERLMDLRAAYATRGQLDRVGVVSVAEAIEFCELVMAEMPEPSALAEPSVKDGAERD